jgi:hypothetical protein
VGAKGGGAITTPPLNDRVFFINSNVKVSSTVQMYT